MSFFNIHVVPHRWCMVSVLARFKCSRAWFRFKPKIIKLVFVASPISTQHQGVRAKTGWVEISILCLSGAACLSAYWCFSELAL